MKTRSLFCPSGCHCKPDPLSMTRPDTQEHLFKPSLAMISPRLHIRASEKPTYQTAFGDKNRLYSEASNVFAMSCAPPAVPNMDCKSSAS